MVPFKPFFLGETTPPYKRATSVQKCVRTLDIDEVGKTTRHASFFQMAGNFSFGDYFKEGAIPFAWELLTGSVSDGGYGFPEEKLWVTVYDNDDEAIDIWHRVAGIPLERIQRRGAVLFWAVAVFGLANLVFSLSHWFWLSIVALAVAGAADKQTQMLGWALAFLHQLPTLSGEVINRYTQGSPAVFQPEETVELIADPLSMAELPTRL